jgi:hypothetical protein
MLHLYVCIACASNNFICHNKTKMEKVHINNKLTNWSKSLLRKLIVPQLAKKFPSFYGVIINMFIKACHWSPPPPTDIQCTPSHPISLTSTSILPSHLCLGLPSGLLPRGILTHFVLISLQFHKCYMTQPYLL